MSLYGYLIWLLQKSVKQNIYYLSDSHIQKVKNLASNEITQIIWGYVDFSIIIEQLMYTYY